jgi:hypothetical protein
VGKTDGVAGGNEILNIYQCSEFYYLMSALIFASIYIELINILVGMDWQRRAVRPTIKSSANKNRKGYFYPSNCFPYKFILL